MIYTGWCKADSSESSNGWVITLFHSNHNQHYSNNFRCFLIPLFSREQLPTLRLVIKAVSDVGDHRMTMPQYSILTYKCEKCTSNCQATIILQKIIRQHSPTSISTATIATIVTCQFLPGTLKLKIIKHKTSSTFYILNYSIL